MIVITSTTVAGGSDPEGASEVASTPMIRVDAYGLLASFLILLMLILAMLGLVAQAATA